LYTFFRRSPHATVEIFKSLKHNFEEADVDRAIQVGSDGVTSGEYADLGDTVADNIHMTVNDMLLALPGINGQNCRKVTDNVESIAHLSEMSVEKLTPLIGPSNAKKLFAFFNNST
jgi:ERCC4-type nuclease